MAVLVEALAVGLVASAVGVAAGLAVAARLKLLLGTFGISLPAGGIVVTSSTIVTGLVVGVVVTLVAAISPARKAGKVPRSPPCATSPSAARARLEAAGDRRVVILLAGVGALLYGLFGVDDSAPGRGPRCPDHALRRDRARSHGLPPAEPGHRLAVGAAAGITGGLASENAKRNPKRTAATASR